MQRDNAAMAVELQMATTSLLLIDGDVNLQAVIARWLEKSGYQILTANNGIQGLRQFYAGYSL